MNTVRNKIVSYINKPYPYYYSNLIRIVFAFIIIFLASFTFSYFFEPFEVNRAEHKLDYFWICIIHSLIPLVLGLVYFSTLSRYQKDERNWTLGKEALHLSIFLFLIGIGSFLVRDFIYEKHNNWSLRYFWEELRNTFLIGFLLLSILLPLNLERLFNKYKAKADKLDLSVREHAINDRITIKTLVASESFEIQLSNFIYAKVDGNYSNIFINSKSGIKKTFARIPLKELENQLSEYSFIFRTHRSYLVNTNFIQAVSGNAQGYLITMSATSIKIPVARTRIDAFNRLFSVDS